jgi:hypothetical protein
MELFQSINVMHYFVVSVVHVTVVKATVQHMLSVTGTAVVGFYCPDMFLVPDSERAASLTYIIHVTALTRQLTDATLIAFI